MLIQVKTKIGSTEYTFNVDERDELYGLHLASVLGNPPSKCDECGNTEHFRLDSNKDNDGNTYVNILCRKCGAKAKLGQYKSKGYFWHKFQKYTKKEQ